MLEHRKACGYYLYPFYKKFPYPLSNLAGSMLEPVFSLKSLLSYLSFPYKDFLYYVLKILDKPR